MVGAAGFEPTTSRSRTVRATSCATPRKIAVKRKMVGEAGIEPAVSRTPSEHSTTEPFPGKIFNLFYCCTYILAFF